MGYFDLPKLKSYALVFLAGITAASVFWVFVAGKNSSPSTPSLPSSSYNLSEAKIGSEPSERLEKVAGATAATPITFQIIVDISGAVKNPGVYSLPAGSRFGEALEAAGGVQPDKVDSEYLSKQINLASEVRDGQKIYIPFQGDNLATIPASGIGSEPASVYLTNLISVNTASSSQLDSLPGVGPATSAKIIAARPYGSLEELVSKKAVSQSVYEKIKTLITL